MKFRPKEDQARLVMTSEDQACMGSAAGKGKVFCVIGPFDDFTDKQDLQDRLISLLRGYNVAPD